MSNHPVSLCLLLYDDFAFATEKNISMRIVQGQEIELFSLWDTGVVVLRSSVRTDTRRENVGLSSHIRFVIGCC
jgi:hypothetical protein